jgi:serpin B
MNEEGTEAAASADVIFLGLSESSHTFTVDHPFLFYLVDDSTGAILFQGRIVDPTDGS